MSNRIVLILVAVFTVILSGLFAGAETGIYQLSQLRLRLGIEKKRLSFVILGKAMHDRTGLLLSMLVGNNLTHYIVTSIVTFLLLSKVEVAHTAELFATFITVPVLFVFSEMIPKNVFFYRADYLMPFFAPVLLAVHKIFTWCGAVPLLKFMSGIFGRLTGSAVPSKTVMTVAQRHYIKAIFADIQEEAIFSSVQSDIINRLISISNVRMRSVMVPVKQVAMVDVNSDNSALFDKLKMCAFTRLPVIDGGAENIIGFINIYEALALSEQLTDICRFIKPIRKLGADTTVIEALNIMQSENHKIALVIPRLRSGQARTSHTGKERPIGIVTMKDLVEELLGELVEW